MKAEQNQNEKEKQVRQPFHAKSASMRHVQERCKAISQQAGPVLIEGETGTGKTCLAAELHRLSSRSEGPFLTPNCGELDNGLIESVLFGHVRGAYTGAEAESKGLLQQADGGTLVLNDIDLLPLRYQSRLLRFLDDGIFYRLGQPGVAQKIDVRLILTTNKDLQMLVDQKYFLPDFYFRIKRWRIKIPALRDRHEDICELANIFLKEYQEQQGESKGPVWYFEKDVLELFGEMQWPGNIRSLREAVENLALFVTGPKSPIGFHDAVKVLFDPEYALEQNPYAHARKEQDFLLKILKTTGWNISATAKITGLARNTIYKRIKEEGWETSK